MYQTSPSQHREARRGRLPSAQDIHFDIDVYLNRIIPRSQLYRLPKPIAHFLGYRKQVPSEVGNILISFWACLGSVVGLLVAGAIFKYGPGVKDLNPPVLFASLGATAILDYNVIHSPLAAPRNAIVGHTLAVIVGVAISKLFQLNAEFSELQWIGGAVACGASSVVMTMTNTIHPPGGATAVLAVIEPNIVALGWWFVPLVALGSTVMLVVALLVNNIQRQYPAYWWTPKDVGRKKSEDLESSPGKEQQSQVKCAENTASSTTSNFLVVGPAGYVVPDDITLSTEESSLLFALQQRLHTRAKHNPRALSDTDSTHCGSDKDEDFSKDSQSIHSLEPEIRTMRRHGDEGLPGDGHSLTNALSNMFDS